jgi:hypothetical protein
MVMIVAFLSSTVRSLITLASNLVYFQFLQQVCYVELIVDKIEQRYGDQHTFQDWSNIKVKKVNKTRTILGNATFHVPTDNSYKISNSLYKLQGGEYRLTPFQYPKMGFCDILSKDVYFMPDLAKVSDFSYPFVCPLPAVSEVKICLLVEILLKPTGNLRGAGICSKIQRRICDDSRWKICAGGENRERWKGSSWDPSICHSYQSLNV